MSDIVEFLRARLDEDEREAKVCLGRWIEGHGSRRRWDRQLREVEAKRRMVDAAAKEIGAGGCEEAYADFILGALATIYADHPDYDPAWQ